MRGNRLTEVWQFLGLAGVCAIIGLLTGWLLPSLLVGALLYIAWHLYRLAALPDIISKQRPVTGFATGLWADVMQSLNTVEADNRRRERDLSVSLDHLRNTVAALPDAVVILQADGRLEWLNTAANTLLGISAPDAAGQFIASLVNDPILDEYLSSADYSRPLTLSAPGNRSKTLLLHVMTIGGDDRLQVIVAQDISRHYHLDESQRDFIANVSHELRTPLTVITGLLEQMGMEESGHASGNRMIEIMQNQAQRMRDLIADLLTLTQIEASNQSPRDDIVPVPELLATIIEEARTLSGTHVLIPEIQAGHGLRGNASELRAAFTNLVVNAIRHTPDRAEVRVCWTADETGARFSVSDSGEGIPARHIPRLTERFYRVDSSRSRDTGGTGLGLAIVRQLLEKHDATLEINSEVGRGSTFTCHFPASRTITLTALEQPQL
jgi:two-component system phosphate regulon sensor histidine kinase PhoR